MTSSSKKENELNAARLFIESKAFPCGLFQQAIPLDVEILEFCEVDGIFAYGIFNPMGPTISAISLLRNSSSTNSVVHYQMLNPFKQESYVIGVLPKIPTQDDLIDIIPDAFITNQFSSISLVGGLPTFFIPGGDMEYVLTAMTCLYQHISENDRLHEMAAQLEVLRKYKGKPWDRASYDMAKAFEKGAAEIDGAQHNLSRDASDSGATIKEWLNFLTSAEHMKTEISGFLHAWEGSIGAQNGNLLAQSAMTIPQMMKRMGQSSSQFVIQFQNAMR